MTPTYTLSFDIQTDDDPSGLLDELQRAAVEFACQWVEDHPQTNAAEEAIEQSCCVSPAVSDEIDPAKVREAIRHLKAMREAGSSNTVFGKGN